MISTETDDYERYIVFPEGCTEEEKESFKWYIKRQREKEQSFSVIYTPNCGCPNEYFVILDRFPMSKKIHSRCEKCGYMMLEISNPIRFHLPLTDKDYTLNELMQMQIMPGRQEEYIKAYQDFTKSMEDWKSAIKENNDQS